MQHQSTQQHARQRSLTVPTPQSPVESSFGGKPPTPVQASAGAQVGLTQAATAKRPHPANASNGSYTATAATAANAAYPRSASSAGLSSPERAIPALEKETKPKSERSKMKLFSKPKSIGISRDKEAEKKERPLPSPNKMGIYGPSPLPQMFTASTTSLADSVSSGPPPTLYSIRNSSTTTLLPSNEPTGSEKPKHHHFLSRQKLKLREKDDTHHHHLPLSSSAFSTKSSHLTAAPPSPGYASTSFAKTVSGLDIRHGGRALREKKREEKATAAAATAASSRDDESVYGAGEWPGTLHLGGSTTTLGQLPYKAGSLSLPSGGNANAPSVDGLAPINLHGFGLVGMTPDDAWPYLKAKLLVIFEGEMLRLPVEDCNKLVLSVPNHHAEETLADEHHRAHIQRCVQARAPNFIMDDLQDLLHTGFSSLNQTLRRNSEERLVPNLAQLWLVVFGTILPYLQAVFLPLDLEFKGVGSILSSRDAQEFWGALPDGASETDTPLGDTLDVRRIVLVSFRDIVILSRYSRLQAVFSRLSLESINGPLDVLGTSPESGGRPDTAASLDPGFASYNSQGSTLLNESGGSMGARSRATSNTSALGGTHSPAATTDPLSSPSAHVTSAPTPQPTLLRSGSAYPDLADSARVTETVGRMLQCVSVLADLKSGDDAQQKMEELAKSMKHNWLGRGRTGRNRKGFVGTKLTGPKGKL